MRFVHGPIPPSRTLDPIAAGWTPLREPSSQWFTIIATALSLPLVFAASAIFIRTKDLWKPLFRAHPWALAVFFLTMLALVPVHEFIHALAYGCGLRSSNLIAGVWPKRGLAYVILDQPVALKRLLFVLAAPFLVLSVALPLALCAIVPPVWWCEIGALFLTHTALCVGDASVIARLLAQLPANALVHNQGWKTFWNVPSQTGADFHPLPHAPL